MLVLHYDMVRCLILSMYVCHIKKGKPKHTNMKPIGLEKYLDLNRFHPISRHALACVYWLNLELIGPFFVFEVDFWLAFIKPKYASMNGNLC